MSKEYVLLINEERRVQLAPLLNWLGIATLEVQGMEAVEGAKYKFVVCPKEEVPQVNKDE